MGQTIFAAPYTARPLQAEGAKRMRLIVVDPRPLLVVRRPLLTARWRPIAAVRRPAIFFEAVRRCEPLVPPEGRT